MPPSAAIFGNGNRPPASWAPMLFLSVGLHLTVLAAVLVVPEALPRRPVGPAFFEVRLVEPPRGDMRPQLAKTVPPAPAKAVAVPKAAEPTKRLSVPPPPEPKAVSIAKREAPKSPPLQEKPKVSASQLIDQAINKIEKRLQPPGKTAENQAEHLDQAIARLEQKVRVDSATGRGGWSLQESTMMSTYLEEVRSRVRANWSYAGSSRAERTPPEAVVLLKVQRDGTVLEANLKRRSANTLFDQSVLRAVQRSDPLPPFPAEFRKTVEELEITFNLRDLEE